MDHSSAIEQLQKVVEHPEIDDQGPIYHYILNEGVFQKCNPQIYAKAVNEGTGCLKGFPSDAGRQWSLFLPNMTQEALHSAYNISVGEQEQVRQQVAVVQVPGSILHDPQAIQAFVSQARMSHGSMALPQTPDYTKLDTRELTHIINLNQTMLNTWFGQLVNANGPLAKDMLKEFKAFAAMQRHIVVETAELALETLTGGELQVEVDPGFLNSINNTQATDTAGENDSEDQSEGISVDP